jgi:hypothetical protein
MSQPFEGLHRFQGEVVYISKPAHAFQIKGRPLSKQLPNTAERACVKVNAQILLKA